MLKIVLLADAVFEGICAIFCFVVAFSFAFLVWGNQQALFNILGVVFLGAAVLLVGLAFRPNRLLIQIVIALNLLGGVAAFAVALFAGLQPVSNGLIVAAAGIVLVALGVLEWMALRRANREPPQN